MLRTVLKSLLSPTLRSAAASKNSLQQRGIHPICGPPKYPLSNTEIVTLGAGWIMVIMIIPIWGLFSIPRWAKARDDEAKE